MSLGFNITERGTEEIQKRLTFFIENYVDEVGKALYQEAELTMGESKELCPVDTGALRASGFVEQPTQEGKDVKIKLGYGGVATKINPKTGSPTTTYAVIVHELHKTKKKFLEQAINLRRQNIGERIAYRVKRMIEGGR